MRLALWVAGCLAFVIGVVGIVGWCAGVVDFIRLKPAFKTMPFVSACAFVVEGVTFIALVLGWRRFVFVTASLLVAAGALATVGELASPAVSWWSWVPPRSHEMAVLYLRPSAISVPISHGLVGLGALLGLGIKGESPRAALLMCIGAVITTLGLMSCLGYVTGVRQAFGGFAINDMSPQSAFLFMVYGATFYFLAEGILAPKRVITRRWLAIPVVLAILVASFGLWYAMRAEQNRQIAHDVTLKTVDLRGEIERVVRQDVLAIERMAKRWSLQGMPDRELWTQDVAMMLQDLPGTVAVAWIDEEGIIRWVVPASLGPKLEGRSTNLDTKRRAAAAKARKTGEPALSLQTELYMGGRGVVAFAPITRQGVFMGYIASSLDPAGLFRGVLKGDGNADFRVAVADDEGLLYASAPVGQWPSATYVREWDMDLYGDARWHLTVAATPALIARMHDPLPMQVLFSGFFSSLLVAGLILTAQESARRRRATSETLERLEEAHKDLVRTEGALKESQERLEVALSSANVGFWSWDAATGSYASPVWKESLGYRLEEFPDELSAWEKYIHPDDWRPFMEGLRKDLARGAGYLEHEFRIRGRDGAYRWMLARGRVTRGWDGHPARILGVYVDLTEQKRSEKLFRDLLELAPEAIVVVDGARRVVRVNSQFEAMFGYPKEELVNASLDLLIPGVDAMIHEAMPAFPKEPAGATQGPEGGGDRQARRKDGSRFPVDIRFSPLETEGGILLTGMIRDMTEARRVEGELKAAKARAEEANRAKSLFLATMSHEIRTPLGVIMGYADRLARGGVTTGQAQEFGMVIKRNGVNLLALIDDVLDLSKVESGNLEIERRRFPLIPFLSDLVSFLQIKAQEKGLRLTLDFWSPIPESIETDELRLRQILINLIGNAIKFTQQGGVRLQVSFCQQARQGVGPEVQFAVADTGCGLTPAAQERIFAPFTQADTSVARTHGGTGLGLSLARSLARSLGGDVELRHSTPGVGSVFVARVACGDLTGIPILDAREQALRQKQWAQAKYAPPPPTSRLEGCAILLAEDFEDNRILMKQILEGFGAAVDAVGDGAEAVRQALAHDYDAILMDLQMPIMSGDAATVQLRQRGYSKPIIALTAHAMKGERERCLALGYSDYVTKPVETDLLVATIVRHVRKNGERAPPASSPEGRGSAAPIVSTHLSDPRMGKVIRQVIGKLDQRVTQLREQLRAGNKEELRTLAHQLRGLGGMAGIMELTQEAEKLERAVIESADPGQLAWHVDQVADVCQRAVQGLQ